MTDAERHQILVEWNRTERDYPRDKCVHQLFEEQVARTPDALAVVFEANTLTYRELNTRANQLARHLRSRGVGPDVLVGLCVERSLDMVVALLGILKAGGAYVPLDPGYPRGRLALMLDDARPPVLLTQKRLAAGLPAHEAKVICLDDPEQAVLSSQPVTNPPNPASSENLAYVIFTSGSTGRPKGAMVPHRALRNHMLWMQERFPVTPEDAILQKTPISFDASGWEVFLPLMTGARLVLARQDGHRDPAYLVDVIQQERVTTVQFVPSLLEWFMEHPRVAGCVSLRRVFCGGEALSLDLRCRVFKRLAVELVNLYGPTETAIDASYWVCDRSDTRPVAPIGKPVANTQLYVLDSQLQPRALGLSGELFIGGEQVGRGYLNRPELTAERFVPDPFSAKPEARLYRTGDLARWLPTGDVEYLGRIDHQVKIRGYRIELGEIEAVVCGHPGVSACVVVAQDFGGGNKGLVAFMVGRQRAGLSAGSLQQWLREKLPDYMIPSRFFAVPDLPLNPNGKLDRKALEKMGGKELATATDYVAPHDERERELAEIWQAVLRRERVGVHDNFFELGGHSLLAVAICAQVNRRLGVEMPLIWLFEHPTIEGLAKQLELGGHSDRTCAIPKADRQKPLPMSFAQQGMWLLQQTLADPATYNLPLAWHLTGRVDRTEVCRALQAMAGRHEILRTALVLQDGNLLQQILAPNDMLVPWQEIDLKAVPTAQQKTALDEQLLAEARRPFDLAQAPLWRAMWIELAADGHVLALAFHHSIVDEWSMRLFLQELQHLYATDGQRQLAGMPELPVQYADYAVWQRQRLAGAFLEHQQTYWREQLRDLPPHLELPADQAKPLRPTGLGSAYDFRISGPEVTRFRELASGEGTTLFTVMLAAYHVWLYRYTGQSDVIVGTPHTRREWPELQSMLGFFLNTLPIRVRLNGSQSFKEVLQQVRETVLAAFSHADLPFEQMVELAVKERESGQQPLYQAMFVWLENSETPLRLDEAETRPLRIGTATSKSDLTLSIGAKGLVWDCRLEYATDLFSADRAAGMARHLTKLFQSIGEHPQKPIGQLDLLLDEEQHQILVEWNRTKRDYPWDKCVHHLFEEQVERTPDAVAVVFESDSLTYRELNTRANRLAHHLRSLGVGPDVLVGLCVERSLDMVVALLGILKAGGAYVPLDPGYPRGRLALMLDDARPPVLLTQKRLAAGLPAHEAKVICLDDPEQAVLSSQPVTNPPNPASSENLAYVIFTSGSTGRPKGAMVPHRALRNHMLWMQERFPVTPEDAILQKTPISFDASGWEVFLPLMTGARLVLARQDGHRDPAYLVDVIQQERVTTVQFVPSLLEWFMEHPRVAGCVSLRRVFCGGEALSLDLRCRVFKRLAVELVNLYGPTETAIDASYWVCDRSDTRPVAPIGKPVANTQLYVLDSQLQPRALGLSGELFIGGEQVGRGYLNRPELTAERFVPDPFSAKPEARLYRTGDLARWLPTGDVEYLGRIDHQVKIRGYRIELGEIEAVVCGHPGVSACVVVAQDFGGGNKGLVAFMVGRQKAGLSAGSLQQWLREKLPDYMIPSRFVAVPDLPLNPNGKVDRKALEEMDGEELVAATDYVAPRNAREQELAEIWQAVLRRERVGVHDDFFALGGHSLLAVRLATEIDKLLGCKLPIAALFQSPTIESLARRLTDDNWAPAWRSLVPLQPQGGKPPLFFVHGWGGDVYGFLELAKLLPSDQPCYGIQAVGLDGRSARHTQVEEMAAYYIKEIVSFQPHGPIYLAGFSMGGIIAFEIARQLHRKGRRVAMLALIDTYPTGQIPWFFYGLLLIPRLQFHIRRWCQLPVREQLNYWQGRWKMFKVLLNRNRAKPSPITTVLEPAVEKPEIPGFHDYYHAVASAYQLRPYSGSADAFVSEKAKPEWRWYWRYLAREGVSFHPVTGDHMQVMFSPDHRAKLAHTLTAVLHQRQESEQARQANR